MDDPPLVRRLQARSDLDREVHHSITAHGALDDLLVKALAFDIFHGDIRLLVQFLDLVDGADVGMRQGSRCLGLPDEPRFSLG